MIEYRMVEKESPGEKGPSPRQETQEEKNIDVLFANVDYISMMTGVEIPTEEE